MLLQYHKACVSRLIDLVSWPLRDSLLANENTVSSFIPCLTGTREIRPSLKMEIQMVMEEGRIK